MNEHLYKATKKMLIFILIVWCPILFAQSKIQFEKSTALTHAKNLAKEQNKPIFIDFYADWSGPCKWMDKNVFSDGEVVSYFNEHFINIKANVDLGGKSLATIFQAHSIPTYLFIDSLGEVIVTRSGSMEKEEMIALAHTAEKHLDRTLLRYEEKYISGDRNPDFLLSYYQYLNAIARLERYEIAAEYLKTQSKWNTPENIAFIFYHCNVPNDDKIYKYFIQHKNLFYRQFKEAPVDSLIRLTIFLKLAGLPKDEIVSQLEKQYSKILPHKKDQYLSEYKLNRLWNEVSDHTIPLDSFITTMQHYFTHYPKGDWIMLRNMALNVCLVTDKTSHLMKSLQWATKALRTNSEDWLNNYTMAALFYRLGNQMSARTFINKAKSISIQDMNADQDMINELVTSIEQLKIENKE